MRKLSMQELGRLDSDAFKKITKAPVVLILDSIRSALNVGSIFRTADAFAVEELALCGLTCKPPHREIEKTALGATETVKYFYYDNVQTAIADFKKKGYQIIGIEQAEGSVLLHQFEILDHQKYAIVLGNEVDGVSDEAMESLDACIEIPQFGTKHSINVAVCAGIVSWTFAKKWFDS
jgi:23S rRNA (guanosine2251-2'-O)-methyltransferase